MLNKPEKVFTEIQVSKIRFLWFTILVETLSEERFGSCIFKIITLLNVAQKRQEILGLFNLTSKMGRVDYDL